MADEKKAVIFFSLLAAVHVFVFSTAFPFFNVVDEAVHFDLVVRYSQPDIPRAFDTITIESLPYLAIFNTPEFFWPPEKLVGHAIPPPPWTLPTNLAEQTVSDREKKWRSEVINYEASQPPLYYAVAGGWWRLGKELGLQNGQLLYSVRLLNVPVTVLLVWLGWATTRKVFPENHFIRLAVPGIIAVMPQTSFYSITNDNFSALTFGLSFLMLLQYWEAEIPSVGQSAGTGLALAGTFLTKISNLPLLAVAAGFLAMKVFKLARAGKLHASRWPLAALFASAGLPSAAWMTWCKIHFGDLTGSDLKIRLVGWVVKPFAEWFHHPIFTPHGLWTFVSGNLATFWQGEFLWRDAPMSPPALNLIYTVLSLGLLAAALGWLVRQPRLASIQMVALWFSFACGGTVLAFFAWLSVKFDFGGCPYPSRGYPYFTSGRLMLGMLIPFLLLVALGLDRLLGKAGEKTKFLVLAGFLLFMVAMETAVDWKMFPNVYNWYHL